jgi:hypothetical protein
MRQLVRQASKDKTGGALRGLKAQFVDEMMQQGQTRAVDSAGQPIISGKGLNEFLRNNRDTAKALFAKEELERLDRIARTAAKLEKAPDPGKAKEALEGGTDAFTDLIARIVGANIGAMGAASSSGAPIVAAGAGSRFARHITNKIPFYRVNDVLSQAVLDKNLMRNLLLKAKTPKQAEALRRRLNSWMVNLVPEIQEEQQQ